MVLFGEDEGRVIRAAVAGLLFAAPFLIPLLLG